MYNSAEGVDLSLEHAPPSSSREGTTRSSVCLCGGFLQKNQDADGKSTGRCTCHNIVKFCPRICLI
jgi:hypothetical protein